MILEITVSLLAVAAFGLALWSSRIASVSRDALKATLAGLSSMLDSELDDHAKEVAVRSAGLGLIVASFNIFWRLFVSVAAAAAPIILADSIGLVSRSGVMALMIRWDFIIVVSVGAIFFLLLLKHLRAGAAETAPAKNRYSPADQFFHVVAFSSPGVLKAASWVEDRLLTKPIREPTAPPIFITSVARAGTTALLNALHDIPGIATHIYRDMPFLTAPSLWNRLAGGQERVVERHERAHGDGLEIDLDTPEALEEVIWKMFWPEKFQEASISLWDPSDRKLEAEQFLVRHMAKIVRARLGEGSDEFPGAVCYCSKNNTNIARIGYLKTAFPGCRIVVPVRRPESHAASLLRQHQNFLKLQAEDAFIQRYMRDIGHFEFGQIHKPIHFPGLDTTVYDPTAGDYWLDYWIHAFSEIWKQRDSCIFVLQDDLRSSPDNTMMSLCSAINLPRRPLQYGAYFRSGTDQSPTDSYRPSLYEVAAEIYREFERISLRPY